MNNKRKMKKKKRGEVARETRRATRTSCQVEPARVATPRGAVDK
jgi:hypothetical protein